MVCVYCTVHECVFEASTVSETAEAACFGVVMPTGCHCGMAMDLVHCLGD